VKSTPARGVKEDLKPHAYKRWEEAHGVRPVMSSDRVPFAL
jgi:hypothetical protein